MTLGCFQLSLSVDVIDFPVGLRTPCRSILVSAIAPAGFDSPTNSVAAITPTPALRPGLAAERYKQI